MVIYTHATYAYVIDTNWSMQYVPGALSNCALLVKVKGSVDVDAVLDNQKQNYDVNVCVEKGMIATASIFSTAGMHYWLSQLYNNQYYLLTGFSC